MKKLVAVIIILSFGVSCIFPTTGMAQSVFDLPRPGEMVVASSSFVPALLRGLKVHPKDPFLFDFIIDQGDIDKLSPTRGHSAPLQNDQRGSVSPSTLPSELALDTKATQGADRMPNEMETYRLIKYFLAALAIKESDMWVNLSPYEKDRMIPEALSQTALGRDMLAQDYILKQLTASMINPMQDLGKEFWQRVYTSAMERYGTTEIPISTFNKVWVMVDKARVVESAVAGFVADVHLKVMLDIDYRAAQEDLSATRGHSAPEGGSVSPSTLPSDAAMDTKATQGADRMPYQKGAVDVSQSILREIIIPSIEKEVNEGKNFASLRQMAYAMILAAWYKMALKDTLLHQVYDNQAKMGGINDYDLKDRDAVYNQYLEAYKRGVFSFVGEELDQETRQPVFRKYFSGGVNVFEKNPVELIERIKFDQAQIPLTGKMRVVTAKLEGVRDLAQNNWLSSMNLRYYDQEPSSGRTASMLAKLPQAFQKRVALHLLKRGYKAVYVAPDVDEEMLLAWIISQFLSPVILERRVDGVTLNIERSRTVVRNLNQKVRDEMALDLSRARNAGLFGVMSVGMEKSVVYQNGQRQGKKMAQAGPGGGGLGVYQDDLSVVLNGAGVDVTVLAPRPLADLLKNYPDSEYPTIDDKVDAYLKEIDGQRLMDMDLPLGQGTYPLSFFYYKHNGAPVIQPFDRTGNLFNTLYALPNPDSSGGYLETALLALAAIEIPRQLGLQFEVYHCQDWQASLTHLYMSKMFADQEWPLGSRPGRLQTMHNLEYQGQYPGILPMEKKLYDFLVSRGIMPSSVSSDAVDVFSLTNLDAYRGDKGVSLRDGFGREGIEYYGEGVGRHALIRSAEVATDGVVAVSEGHLLEALGARSYGLSGMFNAIKKSGRIVTYIYNGIFAKNHRAENLAALKGEEAETYGFVSPLKPLNEMTPEALAEWKMMNKAAVQKKVRALFNPQFEVSVKDVLLAIPTRIAKQKGFNLFLQKLELNGQVKTFLEHLLDLKTPSGGRVQFVFQGTPASNDPYGAQQAAFFRNFLTEHPLYADRFAFIEKYDGLMAKQLGAGADLFPMLSIDEPAGISNLELALLLVFGIVSNRGGLGTDFVRTEGTPFETVSGFEINGPYDIADLSKIVNPQDREWVAQRQKSALEVMDRMQGFIRMFDGDANAREGYLKALAKQAKYNPDWGVRILEYIKLFQAIIQRAKANPDRALVDAAMTDLGGIDLNAMRTHIDVEPQGLKVNFKTDQAVIEAFKQGDFSGLSPRILDVKSIPLIDVAEFLSTTNSAI